MVSRRVGLLGGTFDPVHHGHLMLAEEARHALALERVLFVPAGQPPHKLNESHSAPAQRVCMLELAIAGNPAFGISRVDIERPGPHYSVDMVRRVQEELGQDTELFFLMGLDSLTSILSWHKPAELLAQCRLAAARRPGYTFDLAALIEELPALGERLSFIEMPLIEIAGADLRRRVRCGLPIRYQTPESVRRYIIEQHLYHTP
jgi:nicotinate-nucleotide adenylyltransferase